MARINDRGEIIRDDDPPGRINERGEIVRGQPPGRSRRAARRLQLPDGQEVDPSRIRVVRRWFRKDADDVSGESPARRRLRLPGWVWRLMLYLLLILVFFVAHRLLS